MTARARQERRRRADDTVPAGGLEDGLRALIRDVVREVLREEFAAAPTAAEYLTTRAAAELAVVAEGTIRRWIREGRIVGQKAGRVVRVARADLEALLETGGQASNAEPSPEDLARRDFG